METAGQQPTKGNGKNSPVLMPERMGLAESKRHDWVVDAEFGTTVEQLLEPSYWSHVAVRMVPGDHVEVRAEDFSWVAYLVVHYAERTYAKVVIDRVVKIADSTEIPVVSIKHKVEWKGPHHKFAVIRISDAQMLHSGCKTRGEADDWLRNHEKAQ